VPEVWRVALDRRLGLSFDVVERMTVRQIRQAHAVQAMMREQDLRAEAERQQAAALRRMGR
jgi:hypothetical protein